MGRGRALGATSPRGPESHLPTWACGGFAASRCCVLRLTFIAIPDSIPIGIQGNTLLAFRSESSFGEGRPGSQVCFSPRPGHALGSLLFRGLRPLKAQPSSPTHSAAATPPPPPPFRRWEPWGLPEEPPEWPVILLGNGLPLPRGGGVPGQLGNKVSNSQGLCCLS